MNSMIGRRVNAKLKILNQTNAYIKGAELSIIWNGQVENKGEITVSKIDDSITRDSTKVGNGKNTRTFDLEFYRKDYLMGKASFEIYNLPAPADAGEKMVIIRAVESDDMVQLTIWSLDTNSDFPFGNPISVTDWND